MLWFRHDIGYFYAQKQEVLYEFKTQSKIT